MAFLRIVSDTSIVVGTTRQLELLMHVRKRMNEVYPNSVTTTYLGDETLWRLVDGDFYGFCWLSLPLLATHNSPQSFTGSKPIGKEPINVRLIERSHLGNSDKANALLLELVTFLQTELRVPCCGAYNLLSPVVWNAPIANKIQFTVSPPTK